MTAAASTDELIERLDDTVDRLRRPISLQLARGLANETDIIRLIAQMKDEPARLANALESKRIADDKLRKANEALSAARVEAEWELDGRFETEGNKTFLVITPASDTEDGERKQMTADERRDWKAREAEKVPAVARARKDVLEAEHSVATARDDITVAHARLSATKHSLDAAGVLLSTLRLSLITEASN